MNLYSLSPRTLLYRVFGITVLAIFGGCASVPMATQDQDLAAKKFSSPTVDQAGIYIYRNSVMGAALSKAVSIDGVQIGKTARGVYFYELIKPGDHVISTESEFGENSILLHAIGGKNYFVRQYIKMGVFIGGSDLELVNDEQGMKDVAECTRAYSQ